VVFAPDSAVFPDPDLFVGSSSHLGPVGPADAFQNRWSQGAMRADEPIARRAFLVGADIIAGARIGPVADVQLGPGLVFVASLVLLQLRAQLQEILLPTRPTNICKGSPSMRGEAELDVSMA
jgi:hypothetical protein